MFIDYLVSNIECQIYSVGFQKNGQFKSSAKYISVKDTDQKIVSSMKHVNFLQVTVGLVNIQNIEVQFHYIAVLLSIKCFPQEN